MERTGVQARNKEQLKEAIKNLREYNQLQAKIIREKNEKIFNLTKENTLLNRKLKIITNKYKKITEKYKNKGE